MAINLLYGPGEVSKRGEALRIKKEFDAASVVQLDLKKETLERVKTELISHSLFFTKKLVVLESVSDKLNLEEISVDQTTTLLILAGSLRADSMLLKTAKKVGAKIMSFEGEKETSVFPFLDSLIEKRKSSYLELTKLMEEYGAMYVLTMIYYLLRRNILPLPASDFARGKIIKQKKNYSIDDFANLYNQVLEAEFSIKSGQLTEEIALTKLIYQII